MGASSSRSLFEEEAGLEAALVCGAFLLLSRLDGAPGCVFDAGPGCSILLLPVATTGAASTCCVAGTFSLPFPSPRLSPPPSCCPWPWPCTNGKIPPSIELKLCLFAIPGRCSSLLSRSAAGTEAECACAFARGATGLGGLETVALGSGAAHISQSVREAWLRKVQRGHCFFCSGVGGRGS